MEPGESITETIVREVQEETGLRVTLEALIGVYSDPLHIISYSNGEVRQQFSLCFHCKADISELMVSVESTDVRYFSLDELNTLQIHPAQRIRIQDYLDFQGLAFVR